MKIKSMLIATALISGSPFAFADLNCRADSFGTTRCDNGTTYHGISLTYNGTTLTVNPKGNNIRILKIYSTW